MKVKAGIFYLGVLLLITGCINIYEPFDEPAEDDLISNKFMAKEAIGEGDYTEARKYSKKVLQKNYDYTKNAEGRYSYDMLSEDISKEEKIEFIEYNSIIADSYLQENDVMTLDILNTLSSMSTVEEVKFTDIAVSQNKISESLDIYDLAFPNPDSLNEDEIVALKTDYQTAGVIYGLSTANLLLDSFDIDGDQNITKDDFSTVAETRWSENASRIIDNIEKTFDYLSIAMSESEQGAMKEIKDLESNLSSITESNTAEEVINILRGGE